MKKNNFDFYLAIGAIAVLSALIALFGLVFDMPSLIIFSLGAFMSLFGALISTEHIQIPWFERNTMRVHRGPFLIGGRLFDDTNIDELTRAPLIVRHVKTESSLGNVCQHKIEGKAGGICGAPVSGSNRYCRSHMHGTDSTPKLTPEKKREMFNKSLKLIGKTMEDLRKASKKSKE